jgi:CubicO group peptidase (beta-lactamase class C family)
MNRYVASLGATVGAVLMGLATSSPARAADTAPAASSLLPSRVMQAANDRVAVGEYPMLVIGVVDGDKSRLYGFNAEGNPAPSGDTVFEIGSVTKTFTGLALAEAVKAGKLKLDEPVAKLLPKFEIPKREGKAITLGNLADQHSGLPRLPDNLKPKDKSNPYAGYDAKKLKAFLANYTLSHTPGSEYEYSNLGYGLLGYALAKHAGESYATLIEKKILKPLGMDHCAVKLDKTMKHHLATGHDAHGKKTSNWDFGVLPGAGALRCSASDMLRYLKANMGVVKTKLYPAMRLAHEARADGPNGNRVGMGWLTLSHEGRKVIWHNGMTGGYASFIGFTADGQHGVVVLTNIQQSVDDLGLATLIKGVDLAPAHAMIHMSPSQLKEYVGYYQFDSHLLLSVFRDGDQLYALATGQGAFPVYPSDRDEFFAKVNDISISFLRGHGDKIVGLKLHQNGNALAKRVDAATAAKTMGKTLVPLKRATLQDYVGDYKFKSSGEVMNVTLKGDQLYARLGHQPVMKIYPDAKDEFFYILVKAQLSFERGKNGKVESLTLHQGGANQKAVKE